MVRAVRLLNRSLILLLVALIISPNELLAQQVISFDWTAPTTNADGTPPAHADGTLLTDLDSYALYDNGQLLPVQIAFNQTSVTVTLNPGLHVLHITARDNAVPPNESAPSNAVTINVPGASPSSTPSSSPRSSPSASASASSSPSPAASASSSPAASASQSPRPSPSASRSASPSPSASARPSASPSPSASESASPSSSASTTPSVSPSASASQSPSATPSASSSPPNSPASSPTLSPSPITPGEDPVAEVCLDADADGVTNRLLVGPVSGGHLAHVLELSSTGETEAFQLGQAGDLLAPLDGPEGVALAVIQNDGGNQLLWKEREIATGITTETRFGNTRRGFVLANAHFLPGSNKAFVRRRQLQVLRQDGGVALFKLPRGKIQSLGYADITGDDSLHELIAIMRVKEVDENGEKKFFNRLLVMSLNQTTRVAEAIFTGKVKRALLDRVDAAFGVQVPGIGTVPGYLSRAGRNRYRVNLFADMNRGRPTHRFRVERFTEYSAGMYADLSGGVAPGFLISSERLGLSYVRVPDGARETLMTTQLLSQQQIGQCASRYDLRSYVNEAVKD